MAMSQEHKNLLTHNRLRLVRELIPNQELYAVLESNHTLTSTMVEEIEAVKTSMGKVGKLLDILPRRGSKAFPTFIVALEETHQEHLVKLLDPSYIPSSPSSSGRIISQPKDLKPGADQLTPSATSSGTDRPSAAKSEGCAVSSEKWSQQQPSYDERSGNPTSSKGPAREQQASCERAASEKISLNIDGWSAVEEIIHCVYKSQHENFIFDKFSPEEGNQPGMTESLQNGRCFVFRNNLPKKRSSAYEPNFDDVNLSETFKIFGIKVKNMQEIKKAEDVCALVEKEVNVETTAVFLFMFASGDDDYIITRDSKLIPIVDIVKAFKKCDALQGKPKVLIFHLIDPEVPLYQPDSIPEPAFTIPSLDLSGLSLNSSEDNLAVLKVLPPSGDLKVHWLVSSLIFLMTKYAKKYDLGAILDHVKRILEKQGSKVTLSSSLKNGLYFTTERKNPK